MKKVFVMMRVSMLVSADKSIKESIKDTIKVVNGIVGSSELVANPVIENFYTGEVADENNNVIEIN